MKNLMVKCRAAIVTVFSGALLVGGCDLLSVSDPLAIEDAELADADGAELLRGDAIRLLNLAAGRGALTVGLFTDELFADPPPSTQGTVRPDSLLDTRDGLAFERDADGFRAGEYFGSWQHARRASTVALPKLQAYGSTGARRAHVGEMFAIRGFAAVRLAEDICPGFPIHEVVGQKVIYGSPMSTDETFEYALADLDSAVAYAADSARILNFASIARARALVGLGRFSEAAASVVAVPTTYVLNAEYVLSGGLFNPFVIWYSGTVAQRSISDSEGGNGLDFATANDARLPTIQVGTAVDGVTPLYGPAKYPTQADAYNAPIVIASGIEARLIEAEADLNAGGTDWLAILNDLRATQVTPAMPALSDPGSTDASVDLLFRERAFWLFGTGHRLADLRRLISRYNRSTESVFPTGEYRLGGTYMTATSIPFAAVKEAPFNPAVTGCTSR